MIYLLVNAEVHTRDGSMPVAQALAVKDGRIVEVGGTDEILWLREDEYELIDLAGRAVVPSSIGAVLAPGKRADFLVLSGVPGNDPAASIDDSQVLERWVEGVRRLVRP